MTWRPIIYLELIEEVLFYEFSWFNFLYYLYFAPKRTNKIRINCIFTEGAKEVENILQLQVIFLYDYILILKLLYRDDPFCTNIPDFFKKSNLRYLNWDILIFTFFECAIANVLYLYIDMSIFRNAGIIVAIYMLAPEDNIW